MLTYRRELDGLRAIAVLPVIFFHAHLFGFSGGYAGVDIFFVISGYLITGILLKELATEQYSLRNFYQKRARRILPALFVVVLLTTLVALLIMPTELLKSYANSVLSVVTFTSNIHFFVVSDYFSTAAEQKPLLHTWSLAIEEQYYLFFPILLSFFIANKNQLKTVLITLTLLSLLTAQLLTYTEKLEANFYLIFSRAWELFFGSLIALYQLDKTKLSANTQSFLATTGLILILSCYFIYDADTPFPSIYTLVPVIGASLVICFANKENITGRFLSIKPLVSIGLISYSLYLWHQPLFAFLRMKTFGEPSAQYFLMAIVASFLLAFLSYRYVETPFRKNQALLRSDILKMSAKAMAVLVVLAAVILHFKGFPERFTNPYAESAKASPKKTQCHTSGSDYIKPQNACLYAKKTVTTAVFGDSHAIELAYALSEKLAIKNEGLLHLTFGGCAPALNFEVIKTGCHQWVRESLNYLITQDNIKQVLINFRTSAFLFGEHDDVYPSIPNLHANHRFTKDYQTHTREQAASLYWNGYKTLINTLLENNKKVVIVYPIPEIPDDINTLLTPFSIFGGGYSYDLEKTTTLDYYQNRHRFILDKLNSLTYNEQLIAIKPIDVLCLNNSHCAAIIDNKAMYFDNNHLSVEGARKVINLFPDY